MRTFYQIAGKCTLFALIGGGIYLFAERNWGIQQTQSPQIATQSIELIGQKAPAFQLEDRQGNSYQLYKNNKQAYLINFWATWCAPCIEEFPALLELAKKYKTKNLVVIAIANNQNWTEVENFIERHPKLNDAFSEMTILLDPTAAVSKRYKSFRYPESFLLNKNFIVKRKFSGIQDWLSPKFLSYYDNILSEDN